jgi:hypothetical protein
MSADWETIISTAGEGGSITLLGKDEPSGKWIFRKEVNDIFMMNWIMSRAQLVKFAPSNLLFHIKHL